MTGLEALVPSIHTSYNTYEPRKPPDHLLHANVVPAPNAPGSTNASPMSHMGVSYTVAGPRIPSPDRPEVCLDSLRIVLPSFVPDPEPAV